MKNNKAILFVHGHMGSSKQFDALISALGDSQADIYNISLPGHDGSVIKFVHSDKKSWQKYVDDHISKLCQNYDHIVLAGHSMGGLLLINSEKACSEKLKAIIAVALPLYIKITPKSMRIRISAITKTRRNEDKSITFAREMCGVSGLSIWNAYRIIPNAFGLLDIMKEARAALPLLPTHVTIINSYNDEIVSMKSVDYAKRKGKSVSSVALHEASHFWYPENELSIIAEQIKMSLEE